MESLEKGRKKMKQVKGSLHQNICSQNTELAENTVKKLILLYQTINTNQLQVHRYCLPVRKKSIIASKGLSTAKTLVRQTNCIRRRYLLRLILTNKYWELSGSKFAFPPKSRSGGIIYLSII